MIQVNQLNFHYQKNKPLFTDLDLQLSGGSICGLLGKNGAGKTTLLKLLAGLLFPKTGDIRVQNYRPSNRKPGFLSDLYLIPEEFILPNMSIEKFEKIYSGFYPRFSGSQFDDHLREFELGKNQSLQGLSYGQKKKVLISFGLATNARLLILDEPTNGLDIPSKSQFRSLLASSIDDDKCFLISTHQVRDISNLIDPVVILENGKIIFQATMEEITDKLHFGMHYQGGPIPNALYAERMPGGYLAVTPNVMREETPVDLEVLFNAVIANPTKMTELFANQPTKTI